MEQFDFFDKVAVILAKSSEQKYMFVSFQKWV
jgi:hypothetical protein